jgi:hypothetical protein
MRLFYFRSETDPDLLGHTDDDTGAKIRGGIGPWKRVGSYDTSDKAALDAIATDGYFLVRDSEEKHGSPDDAWRPPA